MRILSIANTRPDPNSGASGTVFHTNLALKSLGHDVHEIWAEQLGHRRITHGNLHALLEQPIAYRSAIRRAYKKNTYDVIISQQPQSYLAAKDHHRTRRAGLFLTMSQGVENRINPILANWRKRLSAPRYLSIRRVASPLLQKLLERQWISAVHYSDGIIVQHSQDMRYIHSVAGDSGKPVHVCPSGLTDIFFVNASASMCSERMNRLLFVGQFAFFKGPYVLAQIINRLLAQRAELSFTWVCEKRHHAQARDLFDPQINGRIRMRDWVAQDQLIEIYDSHGVFIFPTLAEGFAKAPLEAMSRGMCVVASRCCGMADYITDGKSGLLVSVGDVEGFLEAVETLFRSFDRAEALSRSAISAASQYTWLRSAAGLVAFSKGIISSKYNSDFGAG